VFLKKNGSHFLGTISSQRIQLHGENHLLVIVRDVTQRKLIERNLVESEASLQSILNNTEYFIWSVDIRLKLQRFNSRFAAYLKRYLKIELFIGMPILDFTNPLEFRELWTVKYQSALTGKSEVFDVETEGRIYYCMLTPMKVEGVITGVTGYMNDITDSRRAAEQLMLSEANLNATVNNTNFLVWSVDRSFKIMMSNQPFRDYMKEFYGAEIQQGEVVIVDDGFQEAGQRIQKIWHERYQRALAGETYEIEEHIHDRFVKHSLSPIRGKDFISGVTIFSENITRQKLAENQIRENEIKLNAIINNTDLSIWSVDTQYRITSLNNVFADTMKTLYNVEYKTGEDMIAASRGFLPDFLIDYWTVLYKRAFAGEAVLEEYEGREYDITTQNSVHPIIEDNKIVGASVYTRDITELKRKSRELSEANKKIGELKLMALRSVMNPHFIFNALNSIQYFIAKNDRQNAISYLSTFSKLIRGVLTHSVNDKINIADELDLLKYYINLEMVRFENKFDFQLVVDPELDVENIEIPSLLIQPYVENAILHGLYNKMEKGLLKITVCYEDNGVLFVVEDNGVGRKAASQLREKNFPKHKSMGTVLTEERLRLINERDNVSFRIVDLEDVNGPSGTRVNIWVRV
jgi:sensor histidine kinase YesM